MRWWSSRLHLAQSVLNDNLRDQQGSSRPSDDTTGAAVRSDHSLQRCGGPPIVAWASSLVRHTVHPSLDRIH
jgi:hypothetical protein